MSSLENKIEYLKSIDGFVELNKKFGVSWEDAAMIVNIVVNDPRWKKLIEKSK